MPISLNSQEEAATYEYPFENISEEAATSCEPLSKYWIPRIALLINTFFSYSFVFIEALQKCDDFWKQNKKLRFCLRICKGSEPLKIINGYINYHEFNVFHILFYLQIRARRLIHKGQRSSCFLVHFKLLITNNNYVICLCLHYYYRRNVK